MRGRFIHEKEKAIPKSEIKALLKSFRLTYNYIHSKSNLPGLFFIIRYIFILLQIAISSFFPMEHETWRENKVTTNVMNFLSFFIYFGSIAESTNGIIVSFIILAIVFFAILALNFIAMLLYQGKGRIPDVLILLVTLCNDIIAPTTSSYLFSQMGILIGSLLFGEFNIAFLVGIIVLFILILVMVILFMFYYFPRIIYSPTSSLFWNSSDDVLVFIATGVINFCSRLAEIAPGIYLYIFRALYCVSLLILLLYVFFVPLFIDMNRNFMLRGITLGSIIVAIIQTINVLDQDIVFMFSALVFILSWFIVYILSLNSTNKILNKLELLYDCPEDLHSLIRNRFTLILLLRIGIKYGHPYITSLAPFREGILRYPNSQILWEQYLRFVAIYPEENLTLMNITEEIKHRFKDNARLKTLRILSTSILQSRNKHMSSALKHKIKEFDEASRVIRSMMISYWTAISEGSSIAAYDIAEQIHTQREELKSKYLNQLNLFPNNWILAANYSKSLDNLENNKRDSLIWSKRAQFLRRNDVILDKCRTRGLQTFTNLPSVIRDDDLDIKPKDGSVVSKSSVSSRSQVSASFNDLGNDEITDDFILMTEGVRSMGLHTPIPFINHIICYLLVVLIIFGVALPFLPVIPTVNTFNSLKNYWIMIEDASNIGFKASRAYFLLGYTVVRGAIPNTFPDYETEKNIFSTGNETFYEMNTVFPQLACDFSNDVGNMVKDIASYISTDSASMNLYYSSTIHVIYPYSNNLEVEVSYIDALTYVSTQLFGYNSSIGRDFTSDYWFVYTMENLVPVSEFFFELANELSNDSLKDIDHAQNLTMIITIIADVFFVILSSIFIYLVIKMQNKWDGMIFAISRLPKYAIHHTTSIFSFSSMKIKLSDEERLYNSEFIKMATSRASNGGLPKTSIIFLFIIFVIIVIFSTTINFFSAENITKYLISIPQRFILLRQAGAKIFHIQATLNILIITLLGITDIDNEEMLADLNDNEIRINNLMDELIVGSTSTQNNGFMSSKDNNLLDNLFESQSIITENLTFHDYIEKIPDILMFSKIQEILELNIRYAQLGYEQDTNYAFFINHYLEHHWNSFVEDKYSQIYYDRFHADIPKTLITIFCFPIITVAVNIILVITILVLIHKIRTLIRFCLSSLSFIDPTIITQSREITNLLSGSFIIDNKGRSTSRIVMNKVPQYSSEIIIAIGCNKIIEYMNMAAESKWNLKEVDCIDVDFDLVFSFQDKEYFQNSITGMFDGMVDKVESFETSVLIVSSETLKPVKVSLFPVKENKKVKQIIVVFIDSSKENELEMIYNEEKEKTRELQMNMYPSQIRNLISFKDQNLIVISKKIILVVIQLSNMETTLLNSYENSLDNQTFDLVSYRSIIYDLLKSNKKSSHIKTLGLTEYVAFNIDGNDEDATKNAIDFCKSVSNSLKETNNENYIAQFGYTSENKCPMGMLESFHLSFDLFGRCIHTGRVLANNASPNSILIDRLEINAVKSFIGNEIKQKVISSKGTEFTAYEYFL
ncbi:hypothetical protein TRFO_27094 [Tritrichomonas foetus]|uniref:Guanylate cyclase domain-containing protein n=1 Tax=Tritrichomonas foetus TaxID=1144522 RepID=A0A1J4K1W3_9EUKA|nr:hypothetical protein TRFO_27094 [Tritrichomonas foetus]|eukprot:OHT05227.1 hypothetical protein TRFO_27094 [Tritrichomonas foetus]